MVETNRELIFFGLLEDYGLDDAVEQIGIGEFGALAGRFTANRQETSGEWLVPFDGERGYVADDLGK